ncbi:hypothetical protein BU24DRAFT_463496 [Aaosphaeria arxii CBS 175.79]|uniref:Uncharacterized protein n=1 Tax=Aaosphaeria arxii CBS 175.79 TaxID=1450172 RepID=A0A6A5XR04_9PLEO|nr:uncharacterized protein BU24DRAFT_463496 [Aaosphaeria arxii CBS 175.79]KAF2014734.1 hypothetical protein BU24DRAFT_463496 [Aaosphaeria arxii CBS 175.79]
MDARRLPVLRPYRRVIPLELTATLFPTAHMMLFSELPGWQGIQGWLLQPSYIEGEKAKNPVVTHDHPGMFLIPIFLYSVQSLQYIGFLPETAKFLYDTWMRYEHDQLRMGISFLENIQDYMDSRMRHEDCRNEEAVLRRIGVDNSVITSIMQHHFTSSRGEETLSGLLNDIFIRRYICLWKMSERVCANLRVRDPLLPDSRKDLEDSDDESFPKVYTPVESDVDEDFILVKKPNEPVAQNNTPGEVGSEDVYQDPGELDENDTSGMAD